MKKFSQVRKDRPNGQRRSLSLVKNTPIAQEKIHHVPPNSLELVYKPYLIFEKKIFFNENILHKNPITPPTHDERDVWILRTRDAEDEPSTTVDRKRKLKLSYSRRRRPEDWIDHDCRRDHTMKGKKHRRRHTHTEKNTDDHRTPKRFFSRRENFPSRRASNTACGCNICLMIGAIERSGRKSNRWRSKRSTIFKNVGHFAPHDTSTIKHPYPPMHDDRGGRYSSTAIF